MGWLVLMVLLVGGSIVFLTAWFMLDCLGVLAEGVGRSFEEGQQEARRRKRY